MKGDKMAKRSSFGTMVRKRLSDITNSLPQQKTPLIPDNLLSDAASAKEYIEHLVKEKMALVKLIQEKNKIIELSGNEIQKLKTFLQKMQLQNWSLAQSNTHMLAEVNMGKDRLKTLQHELMCKEALLKTKNSQLKVQEEVNVQKTKLQECEVVAEETGFDGDTKPSNATRRRRLSRSQSLGSSSLSHQHTEKEVAVSKRRCVRRQSGSIRAKHDEPREDLFELDDAKFPLDEGEARRTSIARPSRKAAEKVQSYKEIPLNVKMRRSE